MRMLLCRLLPLLALLPASAAAYDSRPIRLELNKLEPGQGTCRAHVVVSNRSDEAYGSFKIDLVFFDKKEVVAQRISLNLAPLRPRKTSVLLFDVPEIDCAGLSKILLNDVTDCRAGEAAKQDCVTLVETASRAPVPLVK